MENLIDGITLRLQNERREKMGIGNIWKVMAAIFPPGLLKDLKPHIQEMLNTKQVKWKEHLTLQLWKEEDQS